MGKLKIWGPEEDTLLISISHATKSKKWKKASEQLKAHGFDRSDVECRERFINHLDPTVNKELWNEDELSILYTKFDEYGNKWFLLQKHLPGRTQTKIKNYFYGNIRFLLKIIVKHFSKKNTGFINDIKTETLLEIYEGKPELDSDSIVHRTIKKLEYKIDKKSCQRLIQESTHSYQMFIDQFLNTHYEKECSSPENSLVAVPSPAAQGSPLIPTPEVVRTTPEVVRMECFPDVTRVQVVCSTLGQINNKYEQMEYLRMMTKTHLKWYEYYQDRWNCLRGLVEEKPTQ